MPTMKRIIKRDYSYEESELLTPRKRERFEFLMGLYFRKKIQEIRFQWLKDGHPLYQA